MRVLVYPADTWGCGHHRLIWPAEALIATGHDVTVVSPEKRSVLLTLDRDRVVDVAVDPSYDVVVFQRVTHAHLAQAVTMLRERGVAVVVDVDDDLTRIHPSNPAFGALHPKNYGRPRDDGKIHRHSWSFLADACRDATLVTTSTEPLLERYARHGRGAVLENYLAEHYYADDVRWRGSGALGWPASVHSHPNDPDVVGNALDRLTRDGEPFRVCGDVAVTRSAFNLTRTPVSLGHVELLDWPATIAREVGIGVAPLADTAFNEAKSWLKPLELSAAGVPWVGSPRREYRRLHELGAGLLAEKPKDWYRALRRLLSDDALQVDLSAAGLDVARRLRLRDHAWKWWQAWEDALKTQRG